jgi:cytochrome b561
VLALMTVRIFYRLVHGAPAPEPTLEPFQRIASHLVHMALYVLPRFARSRPRVFRRVT